MSWFYEIYTQSRTHYALTNQRIIIRQTHRKAPNTRSYALATITDLKLHNTRPPSIYFSVLDFSPNDAFEPSPPEKTGLILLKDAPFVIDYIRSGKWIE